MTLVRKWLAVVGASMGSMAMGLSFSLINTNLETINQDFGASLVQLQWMINIYGIFIASFLVTMGRLGDIFGHKKIYLIGNLLFGIAMLGAGLATSPGMIICFQGLYGVSGAILLPLSQTLLLDIFPKEGKSIAIGIWASSGGITLSLGPIIGGLLLSFLSWRWIFLINVPFAILGLLLAGFFGKERKLNGESKKLDLLGVTLLTLTIGSFVLATVQMNLWHTYIIAILYSASALFLVALLFVEKKVKMPIIHEELFKSRTFFFSCAGSFCMIAFFWAGIFLIPLFIQKQLGFTPLQTGAVMLAFSAPLAIISPLIGYMHKLVDPRILVGLGFVLLSISALMQLQFGATASVLFITIAVFSLGLGFSFISTPTITGAISSISSRFAGIASGTFVTIQEIGGNVGLAIAATISRLSPSFTSGFHNAMWTMLFFSFIGILTAFLTPKKPKVLKKL